VGEVINEYFASGLTKEKDVVDGECRKEDVNIRGHVEIRREEVLEVLENTRVHKSPGPDRVYPKLLREVGKKLLRLPPKSLYLL